MWLATITFCQKNPIQICWVANSTLAKLPLLWRRLILKPSPKKVGKGRRGFVEPLWSYRELKFSFNTWWTSAPHVACWHQAGHGDKAQDPNKPSQPALLLLNSQITIPVAHLPPGIIAHTWPSMHHVTWKLAQLPRFLTCVRIYIYMHKPTLVIEKHI